MISVNTNLKNAIMGKGSQLVRIYGGCYDTSDAYHTFTWTNADIVQGSFYVDKRCVSGSQFSLGNTVSNELGFEIFGSYEDWLLDGVTVMVELGGYVSGTATYFELGKFVLDKPVQKLGRLTFRGYDDLTKLDQNADNWVLNTNSGENILGQAIKPHPQYYMNADGYYNYIRGIVTAPYYASDPLACSTGMIPLSQNGHYPRKIVIKATGNTVDLSGSYFMLFYYNGGSLEVVSSVTWRFDYAGYYASSTVSAGEYHITFDVATGSNKTKFQEYLETQYGENNYFILFTLMTTTTANLSDVSISYNSASAVKIGDTVAEICSACGLNFFAGYPAPYNLTEEYTPLADYSQYSYRTVLGLFAKACGANLTLWPSGYGVFNGDVRFAVPTATGITLTESDVLSCDLADEPVLINGTRFVSSDGALFINRTDNTEPYKYFDFTGCPVFPKDAQTAVDNLSALTGSSMTWLPGQAKILAQPWLEPMDVVNFAYTKAPNYAGRFMITRVRINAMGSTYIESAGFVESTTNSNGYVATDYTPVDPFGVVYSNYNETIVPGLTSNVPMASFTKNLPTVNDYVRANSGFGIVTDINGSFATVEWLAEAGGGGGGGGVTYEFTGGTQSFTAEDSLGNIQPVAIKPQIFKGSCATAAGTVAKVVTCPEFTSADLVAGAVIFVTFSATNSGTAANLTLNVNSTGAKGIRYMRNAAESNLPGNGYLRANMTYRFVYTGTYWVCDTDYDSDRFLVYRSFRVASGAGSLYSYHLVAFDDNGDIIPFNNVTTSATTTYTKAMNTKPFDPFRGFLYYMGTTTTAAGSVRDANEFAAGYTFDCRYSFNINSSGTAGTTALTAYDPVYVRALYDTSTRLATFTANTSATSYLERSSIVQALPSADPNTGLAAGTFYIYILVGQAYSKYNIALFDNNTVFYWNSVAGKTTEFSGIVESNNVWVESEAHGAVYPADAELTGNTFADGSLTLIGQDLKDTTGMATGVGSINMVAYGTFAVSAQSGATSYTVASGLNAIGANGNSYDYIKSLYFFSRDGKKALKPTSVTASGSSTVLTFAESLNPTAAITYLGYYNNCSGANSLVTAVGATNSANCNVVVGSRLVNSGFYSVVGGLRNSNSGNGCGVFGRNNINTGAYGFVAGSNNTNAKSEACLIGKGHDSSLGSDSVAAVGQYSAIASTTAFAVGNGADMANRSNAFEVSTSGETKATEFFENGESLADKYAAFSSGTFTLTDNSSLTFTANYYKIGRQVTVWGTIPSNSSTASALAGLPFEPSGNFQTTLTWTDSSLMLMVVARVSVAAGATNLIPMGYSKVGVSSTSNAGSWLGQIPTNGVPFNFTYITD